MTEHSPKLPEPLLRAIAEDMSPVNASPRPMQLALRMGAAALLISPMILLAVGLRPDAERLGLWLTWIASATQFGLAMALVWIAARESTPSRRLPRIAIDAAVAGASILVVLITIMTFRVSPENEGLRLSRMHVLETLMPPNISGWSMALACGVGSTLLGGVLVLIFSRMFRNSLANRPMMAGLLYGLGAGLAINSAWRVACPISTPLHALGAHGAAILLTALAGAMLGRLLGGERNLPRGTTNRI